MYLLILNLFSKHICLKCEYLTENIRSGSENMTEKIDMDEKLRVMAGQLPGVMNALSGLHSEVVKDGALSARMKDS